MKRTLAIAAVFFTASALFAKNALIASLSGEVFVKPKNSDKYTSAKAGTNITSGQSLKTSINGNASVIFTNKIRLDIAPSSNFKIVGQRSNATKIKIASGKFKFIIPRLKRKAVFEIQTENTSYLAKYGQFVINVTGKTSDLQVLLGQVKIKNKKLTKLVTQGQHFKTDKNGNPMRLILLSRSLEMEGLADWSAQMHSKNRFKRLNEKLKSRMRIKTFAYNSAKTENKILELTSRIKEADIEAGRTLKDIHGNLVRVEQILLRPYADTVQFVNLVKRPSYINTAGRFAYNGTTVSNRIDVLQTRVEFSENLPQNLSSWTTFFDKNNVIAKRANLVMSNHITAGNIYMIGLLAYNKQYNPLTDTINSTLENKLETNGTLYFGTVNKLNYDRFAGFKVDTQNGLIADGSVRDISANTLSGIAWAQNPNATGGWNELNPLNQDIRQKLKTSGDDILFQYKAEPYCVGANCLVSQNRLWLAKEYYVISNEGQVLNKKDFTNSNVNPMTLAQNTAGQFTFYVKEDTGSFSWAQVSDTDANIPIGAGFTNPNAQNIDLVLIPDVPYQAVEKMFPAMDVVYD
ncbi:MAG TPA: FecR domain-containing protein [Elusimicrobiales bacterium]|nr:FecR domain-containing protein [Elusimicrobiales bacterium]